MEVPAIHRLARRHFENASAMSQSMQNLRDELRVIKAEQRTRRAQSMRTLVETAFDRSIQKRQEASRTLLESRRTSQVVRDRERRLTSLERRVRSAVGKAHIFIHLARRASGGHIYAKHQADTFWKKEI
ncbi:MAG TPA: hypothetical protein VIR03_00495 [Candidatus Saccharimonadales bacterium]